MNELERRQLFCHECDSRGSGSVPEEMRSTRTRDSFALSSSSEPRSSAVGARARRHAHHGLPCSNIVRHDRSRAHERAGTDPHSTEDHYSRPEGCGALDDGSLKLPVGFAFQGARAGRRARELAVDEQRAVSDEDLVLELDAAADEGVALDLAARPDDDAALDLDVWPDARLVPDAAAVEAGEGGDDHALSERDVVDQLVRRVVRRFRGHSAAAVDRDRQVEDDVILTARKLGFQVLQRLHAARGRGEQALLDLVQRLELHQLLLKRAREAAPAEIPAVELLQEAGRPALAELSRGLADEQHELRDDLFT